MADIKYYDIDEHTAELAHCMVFTRPYDEGSATANYRAAVDKVADIVEQRKAELGDTYHDTLDDLLDRYAMRLAAWTNAYNSNQTRSPSMLIAGAGNFDTRRKDRQNAREDKLWMDREKIDAIIEKIKAVGPKAPKAPRETDEDKLHRLQLELEKKKQLNAWYRKHNTMQGCPILTDDEAAEMDAEMARSPEYFRCPASSANLANLRASIKRLQSRVNAAAKLSEASACESVEGVRIVRQEHQGYLLVMFGQKPSYETRQALKANGFCWCPSQQAWRHRLTPGAEEKARSIVFQSREGGYKA